jgi:RNA polymerase sigma-70 factor (ECF subfamily)
LKESVALAFVAALQWLTPQQRAALLLRDVVGMSADETADALGLSVSAANGALFRARRVVKERSSADKQTAAEPEGPVDAAIMARYIRAFEEGDVDALIAILREDVTTTMPPSPTWIQGLADHRVFYGRMFKVLHAGAIRLVRVAANGQLAFAFYRARAPGEPHHLRAIEVTSIRGGRVVRIDHFMARPVLGAFGVPDELSP